MRLNWYTLRDSRGYNAGTSVLWTEYGFYQWINSSDGKQVIIEFYPRPPERREIQSIDTFAGSDMIAQAEDAVERDMLVRSGHWLKIREECESLLEIAAHERV